MYILCIAGQGRDYNKKAFQKSTIDIAHKREKVFYRNEWEWDKKAVTESWNYIPALILEM